MELQPTHAYSGFDHVETIVERQTLEAEAWALIQQRNHVPTPEVLQPERLDNARTALMEALTAEGHLSHIAISGTLEDINAQVLSRLLNGWSEHLPWHEKQRRFSELCEELVIQKVHRQIAAGSLPADTAVAVISDYPEELDASTATQLGYRVKNKKGMVRSTHLLNNPDGSYTRIIEQVSRSNGTASSTVQFLSACHIALGQGSPDVAALAAPFVYQTSMYRDGVIDIMRRLDAQTGPGYRYGELQHEQQAPYEALRQESARREQEIGYYVEQLAQLETELAHDSRLTAGEKTALFKEQVERILNAICTISPNYAEATFGKASVAVFYHAGDLVLQGRHQEAQDFVDRHHNLKETVTFCGMSISLEEARKQGLNVNSYGELVEAGIKNWPWKQGVCRVAHCPTRPRKTKVGPCQVCERCQELFNKGQDPTKVAAADLGVLIVGLFEHAAHENTTEPKPVTTRHREVHPRADREAQKVAA